MRLTMRDWKVMARSLAGQYRRARKRGKGVLLNSFIEATGYNRHYGAELFRCHNREVIRRGRTVWVADLHKKRVCFPKERVYDASVRAVLIWILEVMDYACGKRLAPVLPGVLKNMIRHRQICIDLDVATKLRRIGAATIDRLLVDERKKYSLKGRSHTKPGTLLNPDFA